MMFAVAAGEIGIQAAELVKADLWARGMVIYSIPAWSHLLLAAFVIAASWVGWSRSQASLTIRDVSDVLSRPFLVLLLDVLLVIAYIVIVKNVEIDTSSGVLQVNPSALKESFWLLVVFFGYFCWDLLTKVGLPMFMRRTAVSFLCLCVALVAWWFLHRLTEHWRVVFADLAWLALLLLFRAGKDYVTLATARTRAWVVASAIAVVVLVVYANIGFVPTFVP
jgi:hypothetical protein